MFKVKRLLFSIALSLLLLLIISSICYGNSAQPPSILIVVPNAPDDLEIGIGSDSTYTKARKTDKLTENYYTFYSRDFKLANNYNLVISTGNSTFQILLDEPLKSYNNIFTLNLKDKTLTPGKLLSRSIYLVSLRIILTLLLEAIVFWLFGFRNKKSWITFLIINLITQGALNIWLDGFSPLGSYLILTLIYGEIFVFISEIIMFLTFIIERHRFRTLLYVILSNLLSLFAGGYLITILPV